MSYDEKKLDEFTKIIFSQTDKKINAINKEIEEYKASQLTLTKQTEEANQKRILEQKVSQIHSQIYQAQTKMQLDTKRDLLRYRNELLNNIFSDASKRLSEFSASEKYEDYMKSGIQTALKEFDTDSLTLLVKPSDKDLADKLASEYGIPAVEVDKKINLGGFKLVDYKKGLMSDNTFEAKLSEQKQPFLFSCELKTSE